MVKSAWLVRCKPSIEAGWPQVHGQSRLQNKTVSQSKGVGSGRGHISLEILFLDPFCLFTFPFTAYLSSWPPLQSDWLGATYIINIPVSGVCVDYLCLRIGFISYQLLLLVWYAVGLQPLKTLISTQAISLPMISPLPEQADYRKSCTVMCLKTLGTGIKYESPHGMAGSGENWRGTLMTG